MRGQVEVLKGEELRELASMFLQKGKSYTHTCIYILGDYINVVGTSWAFCITGQLSGRS